MLLTLLEIHAEFSTVPYCQCSFDFRVVFGKSHHVDTRCLIYMYHVTAFFFFFCSSRLILVSSTSVLTYHNFFDLTVLIIRMSTFLRRFATSASAGKNMYFILAVASAFPVYTILNDNTSFSASRPNVFVSAKKMKKVAVLINPPLLSVRCCH